MDRLSAFFDAFPLEVNVPAQIGARGAGAPMLYLLQDEQGEVAEIRLVVRGAKAPSGTPVAVEVSFGGTENPLLNSLPDTLSLTVDDDQSCLRNLARAFLDELSDRRCGHQQALHRLGEVIVLIMLRVAIERGSTRPCLLAGLAHPALRSVLVALHDAPAHAWTVEELADRAGLSRSHFMALFPKVVGTTAMSYLTRWRVHLGQRELRRGNIKVKAVARRVGFSSAEAFSRAYQREFGRSPVDELRS
jgi:AraC-like DNA-binding protein